MAEMKWNEKSLLSPLKLRNPTAIPSDVDGRSPFENDYMRIISSPAFRRMQDKAQVFPLDNSDFIRTRLTHSIETSAIASSLGSSIEKIFIEKDILKEDYKGYIKYMLASAAIMHDIGNPPFGHYGENVIQQFFKKWFEKNDELIKKHELTPDLQADFLNFDGNAHALRVATRLNFLTEDENGKSFGMNLTFGTLATLIKYPCSAEKGNKDRGPINTKKFGFFKSEEKVFKDIVENVGMIKDGEVYCRHPLAFIVEAADDIAYSSADIEDGFKKKVIILDDVIAELEQIIEVREIEVSKETVKLDEQDIKLINGLLNYINKEKEKVKAIKYPEEEFLIIQRLRVEVQSIMFKEVVNTFVEHQEELLKGEYRNELLMSSHARGIRYAFKKLAYKIFDNHDIVERELAGGKIISKLLKIFVETMTEEYECDNKVKSKFENDARYKRLYSLISENYRFLHTSKRVSDCDNELYNRLLLVTDFICGMTDSYALSLYQKLIGIEI